MRPPINSFVAAYHLESAADKLGMAADELDQIDRDAAFELRRQAAGFRQRAIRLEAEAKAQIAADEASFRAYDAAHPLMEQRP